jgi:hypothetical protein
MRVTPTRSMGSRHRRRHIGSHTRVGTTAAICRPLVAEVWGGEPYPRGIIKDIEKGAKLTIIETATDGPRLARYRRHPNAIARRQAIHNPAGGNAHATYAG